MNRRTFITSIIGGAVASAALPVPVEAWPVKGKWFVAGAVPFDPDIPQTSEGFEYICQRITPLQFDYSPKSVYPRW